MSTYPPQVNKKLWDRFYEPLILLLAYGKSQGRHVKSDEAWSENDKRLSKRFLDELAYMCDYSPSGDTVAAVAIQDGPRLTYWVAANTNKGSKVKLMKSFLLSILERLGQVYNASDEHVCDLRREISDSAMKFADEKLRRYRFKVKCAIKTCLSKLETQNEEEANNLKNWLISIAESDLNILDFCRLCYEARKSTFLKAVEQRAKNSSIQEENTSYEARFARIRHYIGRLGSYLKAAWILVEAGKHCPQLFTGYSIEIATSRLNFTPPSYRGKSSINGIINRMVKEPQVCEYYQKELQSQDEKFHLQLEKRIRDEYQDPKFKLRTHAEIILLNLFHRQNLPFWDGVRYIGVSKPACFLCYRYFQAHPLQVQTSGCSENLYIQWQPPYIQQDLPALVKEQEKILNDMIQGIRLFVLDKIKPDYRGFRAHPDSTTGLGTSVYADDIKAPFSTDTHGLNPHREICTPPRQDDDFYILERTKLTSDGDVERSNCEPPESSLASAVDNSEEESDGGVPVY